MVTDLVLGPAALSIQKSIQNGSEWRHLHWLLPTNDVIWWANAFKKLQVNGGRGRSGGQVRQVHVGCQPPRTHRTAGSRHWKHRKQPWNRHVLSGPPRAGSQSSEGIMWNMTNTPQPGCQLPPSKEWRFLNLDLRHLPQVRRLFWMKAFY